MLVMSAWLSVGCAAAPYEDERDESCADACSNDAAQTAASELGHDESDSPVPTWSQGTRSWEGSGSLVRESVLRLLGTSDENDARQRFESWTPTVRRGFVILVDKITNEGWLESVDHLEGDPYDSAFHFWPRNTGAGSLEQVIASKARAGVYIENTIANGAFAYLNSYNHQDWKRAWAETDVAHSALHIGVFPDGHWEVHMELYNPMFTKGAPILDLLGVPGLGFINRPLFFKHQRLEAGAAASNRRSANYYHFMKNAGFPLSF